jgi:hypothetical protein
VSDFRYDARRDANEPAIVDALIATGHEVYRIKGCPFDLIVGRVHWCVMEVKTETGRFTEPQKEFFGNGRTAPREVVRSVDEALDAARRRC